MRVFLVLVSLLGAPQVVAAQTPDTTDVEKAQIKYETAARLFDIGQYEQALQGFKDAYMLSEAADLLINIGQCYRALQRNQEAIQSFESYLRVAPTGEHRGAVEQTIAELKEQQAKAQPAALQTEDELKTRTPLTQQPVFYYSIGGVLGASGLLLGGISIGNAIEARQSFDANLLAQSQQQFRKARTTAAIADAFLIGGCVGMYVGYRVNKETLEKENPIGSIKIKKQQIILSIYF